MTRKGRRAYARMMLAFLLTLVMTTQFVPAQALAEAAELASAETELTAGGRSAGAQPEVSGNQAAGAGGSGEAMEGGAPDATGEFPGSEDGESSEGAYGPEQASANGGVETSAASNGTAEGADNDIDAGADADAMADETSAAPSSFRLIVGLGANTELREADVVLGRHGETVLLGFPDASSMLDAFAHYSREAEWCEVDSVLGLAEGEESPTGAPDAVGEDDNALALLDGLPSPDAATEPHDDVLVALVDTGAPFEGDAMDSAIVESVSVVEGPDRDVNGHASAMLAAMRGESPDVRVLSVKALDDNGRGSASSVYAAIEYAVEAGADVVNLSISGYATQGNAAIAEAVGHALDAGAVVVAAAGNGGYDAALFTPGNVDGAFTVGAADGQGQVRPTSNRGDVVDIYVEADSTSVAAARVSGWLSAEGTTDGWRDRLIASALNASAEPGEGAEPVPDSGQQDGVGAAQDITGTSGNFSYTGSVQKFTASQGGMYKLEAWGASGGGSIANGSPMLTRGGYGGYSTGYVHLDRNDALFVVVGGRGTDAKVRTDVAGGYNGGGIGAYDHSDDEAAGAGGGATHFATASGLLKDLSNNKNTVALVAGGGGGAAWGGVYGTGIVGGPGGVGGGQAGGGNRNNSVANQTTGNAFGQGQNGYTGGTPDGSGGGGGGWYGGYQGPTSGDGAYGGGGSGRVGGASCSFSGNSATGTFYFPGVSTPRPIVGTSVAGGASSSHPSISNYSTNGGNGYARVTYVNPVVVTLDQAQGTGGSGEVYAVAGVGVYRDSACSETMTTSANPVTVPTRANCFFQGYYTGQNGTGTKMIDENGFITSNFKSNSFTSAGTLYASWKSEEITALDPTGPWSLTNEGTQRTFTAPQDGWYLLQAWGATGGGSLGNGRTLLATGGLGGYSYGYTYLTAGETLYIAVGGKGLRGENRKNVQGGYNGGGNGSWDGTDDESGGSGGGATHFATERGLLQELSGKRDNVVLVAGGGGGSTWNAQGGAGGGKTGGANGTGGVASQAGGYLFGRGGNAAPVATNGASGGGGGWYGGYAGSNVPADPGTTFRGGGGSGRVGGVSSDFESNGYSVPQGSYRFGSSAERLIIGASYTGGSTGKAGYAANPASGGDGAARVTSVPAYTVTLSDAGGSGGSGQVYSVKDVNVYRDDAHTGPMSASENAVSVPVLAGHVFQGYFTGPDGAGTMMIDENGYRTADFTTGYFSANGTLYASWVESLPPGTGDEWTVPYSSYARSFTAPKDGWYYLQAWGAQGGGKATGKADFLTDPEDANQKGGRGGYSEGYLYMTQGEMIYIYTGQWGNDAAKANKYDVSYNGGGAGTVDSNGYASGAGGGMTHFSRLMGNSATQGFTWNKNGALLVAGGGGGTDWSSTDYSAIAPGGVGGGETGGAGKRDNGSNGAAAGGQSSSGSKLQGVGASATSGVANGGAGGGWWGGAVTTSGSGSYSGAGGSGYAKAVGMVNGKTFDGTKTFVSPGGGTETGHPGNGQAKITYFPPYEITLDDNGGSGGTGTIYEAYGIGIYLDEACSAQKMDSANNPVAVPTREQSVFNGYYTQPTGGTRVINEQGYVTSDFKSTQFAGNGTLYARWTSSEIADDDKTGPWDVEYNHAQRTFTAPEDGWYFLEAWGGNGGGAVGNGAVQSAVGGTGGYTNGYVYMKKDEVMYLTVGGQGSMGRVRTNAAGGYNGGGNGSWDGGDDESAGGGGGATHFSSLPGTIDALSGNPDSVVIVAGGGGGSVWTVKGAAGGGKDGAAAADGRSAGQTSGYAMGLGQSANVQAADGAGGGGGGWWGGYNGNRRTSNLSNSAYWGGGGSGRVGGQSTTFDSDDITVPAGTYLLSDGATQRDIFGATYKGGSAASGYVANPDSSGNGYARIEHLPIVEITLDEQSGSGGSSFVYEAYNVGVYRDAACFDEKMDASTNPITVPTRANYEFGGYFTGANGTGTLMITKDGYITENLTKTTYTANTVLYACWVENVTGENVDIPHTGTQRSFTAPKDGWYKLQVWGGNGGGAYDGSAVDPASGGTGGYSYGYTYMKAGDVVYLAVGGSGASGAQGADAAGGFNGGGSGSHDSATGLSGGAGGGASHFASVPGSIESLQSQSGKLIVVAGGGGGSSAGTAGAVGGGKDGGASGSSKAAGQGSGNAVGLGQSAADAGASGNGGGGGGWYGGYTGSTSATAASSAKYGGGGSGRVGGSSTAFDADDIHVPSGSYLLSDGSTASVINGATYPGDSTADGYVARDASWGQDGRAHVTYLAPFKVVLNDADGSGGSGQVFQAQDIGVFLEEACVTEMSPSANPVNVPTRAGYVFDGYYTSQNGSGDRLINARGYATPAFEANYFSADGELYAHWIKEEIYDGSNGPWDAPYTGIQRSFTAPKDGWYRLQGWGAQGGGTAPGTGNYNTEIDANQKGGRGGYSQGYVYLTQGQSVYIYAGQWGNNTDKLSGGGALYSASYNGGGAATSAGGGAGGGMTHFSKVPGNAAGASWDSSNVLLVAGGGGGTDAGATYSVITAGGVGGGNTGGTGGRQSGASGTAASAGGQTASGSRSQGVGSSVAAGSANGAGGGGWWGGAASSGSSGYFAGAGGSGYVGATALSNGSTQAGTETFEAPGGGTETGHPGDGYARVTYTQPNVISLNVDTYDTRGAEKLYEAYGLGVYHEEGCRTLINTTDNPIDVPTRSGYSFGGYFTGQDGTGVQVIDAYGFLTSAFTNTYFASSADVYAYWVKDITSTGTDEWNVPFEPETRSFTAPHDGWYKLQAWGAQGGGTDPGVGNYHLNVEDEGQKGGRGGYSAGYVFLYQGDVVYLYTGQWGNSSQKTNKYDASYNGGGAADASGSGGAGGGMTHVSTQLANTAAAGSSWDPAGVLVVAGGGGGSNAAADAASINGAGVGGGASGGSGSNGVAAGGQSSSGGGYQGTGASAVAGSANGAGGGGWWGGGSASGASGAESGAGGSGYAGATDLKRGETHDGTETFESPNGGTETGHPGDGYLRITAYTPMEVTLEDGENATGGSGRVYEAYDLGVYLDEYCSSQMTASANPVNIPSREDAMFDGYYTERQQSGSTGVQMISANGRITSNFTNKYFAESSSGTDRVLYAHWVSNEVTDTSPGNPWDVPYNGSLRTFRAPQDGWYLLEGWGASGGGAVGNGTTTKGTGATGGYSYGYTYLHKDEVLHIAVGGQGEDGVKRKNVNGGFNGGGSGSWDGTDDESSGGGGGATHFATSKGLLPGLSGASSNVVLVAGGGGGAAWTTANGFGGGQTAGASDTGRVAGQSDGYSFGQGENGVPFATDGQGGGGGGWYGGYAGRDSNRGDSGGGSGRVGGKSSAFDADGVTVPEGTYQFGSDPTDRTIFGASYAGNASGYVANPSGNDDGFARITYKGPVTVQLDNQRADSGNGGTAEVFGVPQVGVFADQLCTLSMSVSATPITVPSRAGYIFDGYYTMQGGQGDRMIYPEGYLTPNFTHASFSAGATLYANWLPVEIYDANNGPWDAPYARAERTFTAPEDGWYKLQAWGAQGGGTEPGTGKYHTTIDANQKGGRGGYTEGQVYLRANQTIYLYTGQWGNDADKLSGGNDYYDASYNGGGAANVAGNGMSGGAGGGMTHFSITAGNAAGTSWRPGDALVVAGGGGGTDTGPNYYSEIAQGGVGGGESGGNGAKQGSGTGNVALGGRQVASGSYVQGTGSSVPAGSSNGAGGGGWWGGASSLGTTGSFSGAGGSGYAGDASVIANGSTLDGKQTFEAPAGGSETGHPGNGYARVSYLPTYTITLDDIASLGGAGGSGAVYEAYTVGLYRDQDCATVFDAANPVSVPTAGSYRFAGYYTGKDGTGAQLINKDGEPTSAFTNDFFNSNATLYAYWIEDISATGVDDVWNVGYKDMTRSFRAPRDGWYRLQAWGAQGGGAEPGSGYHTTVDDSGQKGGRGGYTEGQVFLNAGDVLYIHTGQWGNSSDKVNGSGGYYDASYNGGGAGDAAGGGAGGGMTHFALSEANTAAAGMPWDNSAIVLAAGGGGGSNAGATISGINAGGVGGGVNGGAGGSVAGGQSSSGSGSQGSGASVAPGSANGAGGGGWWGGGASSGASGTASGAGGSGYIGYAGLQLGSTLDGTKDFVAPDGGTETGHPGDGYARISYQPPYKITLDDGAGATGGNGYVYEAYGVDVYLDEACSMPMTASSNRVASPQKQGSILVGYFTMPDGQGGDKLIGADGYRTTAFTNKYFNGDATLYAHWESEEITYLKESDTSWDAPFAGAQRTFTAPQDGWYLLEGWGGDGGGAVGNGRVQSSSGGSGGYSYGYTHLKKDEVLYIAAGGKGATGAARQNAEGGYNGGGNGSWDGSDDESAGAGGGATHFATSRGLLDQLSTTKEEVVLVAGGGGGSAWTYKGGAGGSEAGQKNGINQVAGQTSGNAFGQGGNARTVSQDGSGGGGGGWYGGYNGATAYSSNSARFVGGGGSGRVGGLSSDFEADGVTVPEGTYLFGGSSDERLIIGASYRGNSNNPSGNGDGYARVTYQGPYTITLDPTEGSGGSDKVFEAYGLGVYLDQGCNDDLSDPAINVTMPTRAGYDFGGYFSGRNGTGTRYISSDGQLTGSFHNKAFTADTTLYAKWSVKAHALLTDDCTKLVFFREDANYTHGQTYTVTIGGDTYTGTVYEGIESAQYATAANVPWLPNGNATLIESVKVYDTTGDKIAPISTAHWFDGCASLVNADIAQLDTSQAASLERMFANCIALEELDLTNMDTSSAANMTDMFVGDSALRYVTLGQDFSFQGAGSTTLTTLPDAPLGGGFIGKWVKGLTNVSANARTAIDLANVYDGSTMAGLYEWAPLGVLPSSGSTGADMVQAWLASLAVVVAAAYLWMRRGRRPEAADGRRR